MRVSARLAALVRAGAQAAAGGSGGAYAAGRSPTLAQAAAAALAKQPAAFGFATSAALLAVGGWGTVAFCEPAAQQWRWGSPSAGDGQASLVCRFLLIILI